MVPDGRNQKKMNCNNCGLKNIRGCCQVLENSQMILTQMDNLNSMIEACYSSQCWFEPQWTILPQQGLTNWTLIIGFWWTGLDAAPAIQQLPFSVRIWLVPRPSIHGTGIVPAISLKPLAKQIFTKTGNKLLEWIHLSNLNAINPFDFSI